LILADLGGEWLAGDRDAALPSDPGGWWSPEGVTRRIRATEKTATVIHERYSDELLEALRDKVGHDVPCPGLWVLVATDGQHDLPMLDNAEIPLITPGQRARVSEAWVDNVHRGQSKPMVAADGGGRRGR